MNDDVDQKNKGLDLLIMMLMKTMTLTEVACVLTFIWDCFQLVSNYKLKVKVVSGDDEMNDDLDWMIIMLMKTMILTEVACVLTFICPPLGAHHSPVCVYTYDIYKK